MTTGAPVSPAAPRYSRAVRSVPVKGPLVQMMAERFPDFPFAGERSGLYGFIRRREDFWFDCLAIARLFDSGRGVLTLDWTLTGVSCVPGWYDWCRRPYRCSACSCRGGVDPAEPVSLLADLGPDFHVCYQSGPRKQLPLALDVLADKLQRYALPALQRTAAQPLSSELRRWHALAACVLPQIDALDALEREALAQWQKAALRRGRTADLPPMLQKWLGEIASLPGFREEYSISPILQDWIFSWIAQVLL